MAHFLWTWIGSGRNEKDEKTIVVTVTEVSRLDAAWRARWNRPPTDEELLGVVRDHVREIALYRHAVEMIRQEMGHSWDIFSQQSTLSASSTIYRELAKQL